MSSAGEPVAVCFVVVVVVHRVSGFTQPRFLASLQKAGRSRGWSPEQGGEFLDAAFMAPADV